MQKILCIRGKRKQGPGVVPSRKVAAGAAFTGLWPPSEWRQEGRQAFTPHTRTRLMGSMTIRAPSEDVGQPMPHTPKETWQANVTDKGEKR
jgi:hypothetical protein